MENQAKEIPLDGAPITDVLKQRLNEDGISDAYQMRDEMASQMEMGLTSFTIKGFGPGKFMACRAWLTCQGLWSASENKPLYPEKQNGDVCPVGPGNNEVVRDTTPSPAINGGESPSIAPTSSDGIPDKSPPPFTCSSCQKTIAAGEPRTISADGSICCDPCLNFEIPEFKAPGEGSTVVEVEEPIEQQATEPAPVVTPEPEPEPEPEKLQLRPMTPAALSDGIDEIVEANSKIEDPMELVESLFGQFQIQDDQTAEAVAHAIKKLKAEAEAAREYKRGWDSIIKALEGARKKLRGKSMAFLGRIGERKKKFRTAQIWTTDRGIKVLDKEIDFNEVPAGILADPKLFEPRKPKPKNRALVEYITINGPIPGVPIEKNEGFTVKLATVPKLETKGE